MGWFRMRLVKGGPFVPAKIWIDRTFDEHMNLDAPEEFKCEVDGEPRDPYKAWSWLASNPISREQYEELKAMRDQYSAMPATHAEIDLSKEPVRP